MKLTRHRGHGGGWEAVDIERPHLVDLGGGKGHAGRQVATVTGSHEGRLLLHQLPDRDREQQKAEREKEREKSY